MFRLVRPLFVAAAIVALAAGPASAKHGKPQAAVLALDCTPTISAPSTVTAGEVFAVTGTCADPTFPVFLEVRDSEVYANVSAGVPDVDGNVGPVHWVDWTEGETTVSLFSRPNSDDVTQDVVVGTAVVTVTPGV